MVAGLFACKPSGGEGKQQAQTVARPVPSFGFPYQTDRPDEIYKLPGELQEVSGIHYLGDNRMAAVQDEQGIIFVVDLKEEKITADWRFEDDGDFEDLEITPEAAWVIRSDGKLYKVTNWDQKDEDTRHRDTPLSAGNDVEGLGFWPEKNLLLLACKGEAGLDKHLKHRRAIYGFDIATSTFLEKPLLLIDLEKLEERAGDNLAFAPSGIAVHPLSGNWYIISSVGKLLLVFSPEGELLVGQRLTHKDFKQPEGITFAEDGTLYISNEGRGGKPNIMQFNYQQTK